MNEAERDHRANTMAKRLGLSAKRLPDDHGEQGWEFTYVVAGREYVTGLRIPNAFDADTFIKTFDAFESQHENSVRELVERERCNGWTFCTFRTDAKGFHFMVAGPVEFRNDCYVLAIRRGIAAPCMQPSWLDPEKLERVPQESRNVLLTSAQAEQLGLIGGPA